MTIATCQTEGCPSQGVAFEVTIALGPDESVFCGGCGKPTELTAAPDEGGAE
jgi:hypothetical protein